MFAAIARRDDALLCIAADSTGSLWRRATKLSAIEAGHINNAPKRFHEAPIDHTFSYDIIADAAIERFADCMSEKMGNKRFGYTMRVHENSQQTESKLNEIFKICDPTV